MIFPRIHLNGTHPAEIQQQAMDGVTAINDAIRKIERNPPNARDYYVQGPDAFRQAMLEHGDRVRRLCAIQDEFNAILENVDKQIDEREARKAGR